MKQLFVIAIVLLLIPFAYSYRLIDSETFASYTAWAYGGTAEDFITDSAGKWNCSDSAYYPDCADPFGGDDYASNVGGYNIGVEGTNQYLLMYSLGGDCLDGDGFVDYWDVGLQWRHANSSNLSTFGGASRHIIQYKMKVIQGTIYNMSACGSAGQKYHSIFKLATVVNSTSLAWTGLGGTSLCSPYSDSCFNGFRSQSLGSIMIPPNDYCDVSDGNWHDVKVIYYVNSSYYLTRWETYIDDNLCTNYSTSASKGATGQFFFYSPPANSRISTTGTFSVYYDNIALYEANESEGFTGLALSDTFSTTCDAATNPYYLKESFNGYLSVCNWTTSFDYFTIDKLTVPSSNAYYYAENNFQIATDIASNYAVIKFDLNLVDTSGSNWDMRLYDNTGMNFINLFSQSNNLYYNENGLGKVFASGVSGVDTYALIIDFVNDRYDLYENGGKVITGARYVSAMYNLHNMNTIKFQSTRIGFTLDNVQIYASDATGNPITGDTGVIFPTANNETMMCGLVYRHSGAACSFDSQCPSGDCLPNGKCSQFKSGYCDETGQVRGGYCYLGAVAKCTLSTTAGIMLDNFLYVLVIIVFLIIFLYIKLAMRK